MLLSSLDVDLSQEEQEAGSGYDEPGLAGTLFLNIISLSSFHWSIFHVFDVEQLLALMLPENVLQGYFPQSTYLICPAWRRLGFKNADSLSVCYAGVQSPPVRWLELQAGISEAGRWVVSLQPHLQGKQDIAGVERKLKTKVAMINDPL